MLVDGTELGGRAEKVGQICSEYAQNVTQLRARRFLASSTFSYLAVPMHATTTFILVFVLHIISGFNKRLSDVSLGGGVTAGQPLTDLATPAGDATVPAGVSGSISIFEAQEMGAITAVILLVITILTIANALAPKFASGGSNLKIASYLSLMCLISGAVLGVVPFVVTKIFST